MVILCANGMPVVAKTPGCGVLIVVVKSFSGIADTWSTADWSQEGLYVSNEDISFRIQHVGNVQRRGVAVAALCCYDNGMFRRTCIGNCWDVRVCVVSVAMPQGVACPCKSYVLQFVQKGGAGNPHTDSRISYNVKQRRLR